MAQLNWGQGVGLHFQDNHEYYETLGFLAKRNRSIDMYTHNNKNNDVWSGQGKLETRVGVNILPRPLKEAFKQLGDARLTVTEYILNLKNHGFTIEQHLTGSKYLYHLFPASLSKVSDTIESEEYLEDFFRGYNW